MRVLLFTGKGGVGKTTAAAATAALAAARGHKSLVVSTDPAHSLSDALGVGLGDGEPTEVDTGLHAMQVETQRAFERSWREVQGYLLALLDTGGMDPVEAEELTVLPGADEVLALLAVRDQVRSGRYDLVAVDCAPTSETLRLLALPEVLSWWMSRLFPVERRVARALRPMLGRAAGLPTPPDRVFAAVARLQAELADVRSLLVEPDVTSVRLVVTPESVVVAEARRMFTTLSLYGYRVDGVLVNRVFPTADGDAWRSRWVAAQASQLELVEASFFPLPVWRSAYRSEEPIGLGALLEVGADAYGDDDPMAAGPTTEPLAVEPTTDGFALSLALPFVERAEIELTRRGDELAITVGAHRRLLNLPSALRRCVVDGARLVDGRLVVRFVPDPAQWIR